MTGKEFTLLDIALAAHERYAKLSRISTSEYSDTLPGWIPKYHRQDCVEIWAELSMYLSGAKIAEYIKSYEQLRKTARGIALFGMNTPESFNGIDFQRMIRRIFELETAIALGEEKGLKLLDREDRKKEILSKGGKSAVKVREEGREEVIYFALALARQEQLQDNNITLDEIALNIAPQVIKHSKSYPGRTLRSYERAPRTILNWLKKAESEGDL